MDFYYTPTTCSQAAHILLHEAGLEFRARRVDIFAHRLDDGSDYARINPNGYVPALVLNDGTLLTENVALLDWIACQGEALIPAGDMGRTRQLQMLAFVSTELQKPFVRLFFTEDAGEKLYLRQSLAKRFDWIRSQLQGDYIFGDRFTASDAFVYVMLRWAETSEVETPRELRELASRAERRDAVRVVLANEEAQPLSGSLIATS